jgi:hypothetical protein
MKIIYKTNGQIAIVCPTPEALAKWGIDAIARKDVPEGHAYKFLRDEDIPADLASWTIDDAELTDGVGAPGNEFPPEPPAPDMSAPPQPLVEPEALG